MLKRPDKITPPPPDKYEKFKVCIIGSQGVGKTALLNRLADNTFSEKYEPTVGSDFKIFKSKGVKNVQLNFWDLSGDPSYVEVRNEFYKDGQPFGDAGANASVNDFDAFDDESDDDIFG